MAKLRRLAGIYFLLQAVAIYLGSVLVLAHVLLGSFLWQCVARPVKEDDLLKHFGADYDAYRRQVRCWCPRLEGFAG